MIGSRRTSAARRVARALSCAAALAVLATACADDGPISAGGPSTSLPTSSTSSTTTSTSTTIPPDPPYLNWVAFTRAGVPGVDVAESPGGPTTTTVANPNEHGVTTVFLVVRDESAVTTADGTEWHRVLLPIKPNGSTGWVASTQVELETNTVKLTVDRTNHVLVYEKDGEPVAMYRIAVGKSGTETPAGLYFIKELLEPTNPNGAYGPFAYGLSGFSNTVLGAEFGDGVIGIHGTNDPSKIGTDVSHGCIRVANSDITALVDAELPLGTPVEITA